MRTSHVLALSAPFPEDEDWQRQVEKYFEMVRLPPDNLDSRQSLRQAEYRVHQVHSDTITFLTKTRLASHDKQLVDLLYAGEFAQLDHFAEEMLKLDPRDPIANLFAAKACLARGYHEVGRFLLTCSLQPCLHSRFLLANSLKQMTPHDLDNVNWSDLVDVAVGLREDRWR